MSEYIEKEWQACKLINDDQQPMSREELIEHFTTMIDDGFEKTGKYDFFWVHAEHADGGSVAICTTGNGPNSEYHAMAIAALPDALRQLTTLTEERDRLAKKLAKIEALNSIQLGLITKVSKYAGKYRGEINALFEESRLMVEALTPQESDNDMD